MNESETRKVLIDQKLALAGWNVHDKSRVRQELHLAINGGFADYALVLEGKPGAVVEAKSALKDADIAQEQALQYAEHLQASHGVLPIVTYTNGYDVQLWESGFYPPRKVQGFPNLEDLSWMVQRRGLRKPLSAELINTDIVNRDYQIQAIREILLQVEKKRRHFLLVLATGTGKTRVAVALADVLRRAKWVKRVLFLVDRIALRDQALDAFKEHIPTESRWPKEDETAFARDRRLYVATYPTMLNLIHSGTTAESRISPFFFDLVIADESHRSIYNTYRQALDYFYAIRLGLTATPTRFVDHDTFKLFDCAANDPTFAYTYEEAVEHVPPYLCDFEVLKVRSKFQLEGIKGAVLPPLVQKQLVADGKDVEDIDFEGTELERRVTNSGTNAVIVREFMEESIKDATGTLPGKSIIFAISKAHAWRLQKLFDDLYPEHKGKLARVLVSEDSRVYGKGGLLDQFKTEDMPRVAISVDMLDTGVDVPEVVNLVFAKPVFSYTKFWQMIGRGTRILHADPKKRRAWCLEKEKFLIIDCWGNFDFFKMTPKGREPGGQVALPVKLFLARLDKLEAAIAVDDTAAIASAKTGLRADLAALPQQNVVVTDAQELLQGVTDDAFWTAIDAPQLCHLRASVAPLLRARSAADGKAMRFEVDVVEVGTALLAGNAEAMEACIASIVAQVGELPLSVNVVAKEQDLIADVLTAHWWTDITDDKLADLVSRLGPLMDKRRAKKAGLVMLDIEDLVVIKEMVEFGPQHERLSTTAYRARIEAHVQDLVASSPALQKLQQGGELTAAEVKELAETLAGQDPYVTEELLRWVYDHKTARFIRFIKHILGLEVLGSWPETVSRGFDEFIAKHNTFSAMQIQFLRTLQTFVLQRGQVAKPDLIAAPFTQIHPKGILGVFQPDQIKEILAFTSRLVA